MNLFSCSFLSFSCSYLGINPLLALLRGEKSPLRQGFTPYCLGGHTGPLLGPHRRAPCLLGFVLCCHRLKMFSHVCKTSPARYPARPALTEGPREVSQASKSSPYDPNGDKALYDPGLSHCGWRDATAP